MYRELWIIFNIFVSMHKVYLSVEKNIPNQLLEMALEPPTSQHIK